MSGLSFPVNSIFADRAAWPLSVQLFKAILNDEISDTFVVTLVWERLGYIPDQESKGIWHPTESTPLDWKEFFSEAPQVIVQRQASVVLTRSIPKQYKQLLKDQLGFTGYKIGDLFPRRTRRATVVSWLLAWIAVREADLVVEGPTPKLMPKPMNPVFGHPGDPSVQ